MSIFDQKDEILKQLEEWFQSEHPSDKFNDQETAGDDVSIGVKSILAVAMNEDEVIAMLEEIGLDSNFQTAKGFKVWQLAMMHGRKDLAKRLYQKQEAQAQAQTKHKMKGKKK